jgi:hypothetical protein
MIAGLAALVSPGAAAAAHDDGQSAAAIQQLRETVERQFNDVYTSKWSGVSQVRQQQRTWMTATHKYPEFIEVGLDVWDNVYDWHVVFQQPLNVTRLGDGRYAMAFMFTTLLLRPEVAPHYVSYPFDVTVARPR